MSRRARVTPERAGIPAGTDRRVPGLRRTEVAMLAGVSVEYYTRLERGSIAGVSDSVLEAVAGALQLDEAERPDGLTYLGASPRVGPEQVVPVLDRLLRAGAFRRR